MTALHAGTGRQPAPTGYTDAVRRTRERATTLLGDDPTSSGPAADDVVDLVTQTLDQPGAPGFENPDVAAALARIRVADLESRAALHAVPLLVIAGELGNLRDGADIDRAAFAEALTAFVVRCHTESSEIYRRQHVLHAVREYLARRRQDPDLVLTLPRELLDTGAGRAAWDDLAERIPWIRWLAPEDRDPPRAVPVGPAELVDLLVLLRPRQQQRFASDRVSTGPLPARFSRIYRSDVDPETLDDLAEAMSWVLCQPAHASRLLQALGKRLPRALDAAAQARVHETLKAVTDSEHLLAVRVDDGAPRVLLLNLSTEHRLQVQLDDRLVTLEPSAVDQAGAAGYCSDPVPISAGAEARMGRWKVPLHAPPVPMAEIASFTTPFLPPDVFRGRETQLATLRAAMTGRDRIRPGSLISGPRRAGKSTLMEYAGKDSQIDRLISIDVSNTMYPVSDFREWSRDISKQLATKVRQAFPDITIDTSSGDFVGAITDLDDALAGRPPVALALDELDVLLLPDQGSGGLRAAGRLGNQVFRNLVVMGTVQRFHRTVHEFKTWQTVYCPADLSWRDGVTYFFGPLHDPPLGRVGWLTWAGVSPRHFAEMIAPFTGLRPYFWGQLRSGLEAAVRAELSPSRLVGPELLRVKLDELVDDGYLNSVMDNGALLDPAERRRKDLFSDDERRILLRFAVMDQVGGFLSVREAKQLGGDAAIKELVNRAWLTYDETQERLQTAVSVYHRFLQSRVSDLREVTPDAHDVAKQVGATGRKHAVPAPASPVKKPSGSTDAPPAKAPSTRAPVAKPPAARAPAEKTPAPKAQAAPAPVARTVTPKPPTTRAPVPKAHAAKGSSTKAAAAPGPVARTRTGQAAAAGTPGPKTAKVPTGRKPAPDPAPEVPRIPPQKAQAPRREPPPPRHREPTDAELATIRAALRDALAAIGDPLPFSNAGEVVQRAVPRINASNKYCGAGKLTNFFETYLPDFPLEGDGADRVVRSSKGLFRRILKRVVLGPS